MTSWGELVEEVEEAEREELPIDQHIGEEEDTYELVKKKKTKKHLHDEDIIFLFNDHYTHDHPRYKDVCYKHQLKNIIKTNRNLYRQWHSYSPIHHTILCQNQIIHATPEYREKIQKAIPDCVWNKYIKRTQTATPKPSIL